MKNFLKSVAASFLMIGFMQGTSPSAAEKKCCCKELTGVNSPSTQTPSNTNTLEFVLMKDEPLHQKIYEDTWKIESVKDLTKSPHTMILQGEQGSILRDIVYRYDMQRSMNHLSEYAFFNTYEDGNFKGSFDTLKQRTNHERERNIHTLFTTIFQAYKKQLTHTKTKLEKNGETVVINLIVDIKDLPTIEDGFFTLKPALSDVQTIMNKGVQFENDSFIKGVKYAAINVFYKKGNKFYQVQGNAAYGEDPFPLKEIK